jgi:hypothetical protein
MGLLERLFGSQASRGMAAMTVHAGGLVEVVGRATVKMFSSVLPVRRLAALHSSMI